MFWQKAQRPVRVRSSVQQDWIAWLPLEKRRLYDQVARAWEDAYAMLSVALNDAISSREQGQLARARENIGIAAKLISRLAEPLLNACQVLEIRARYLSNSPAVAPLDPANFRTHTARQAAGWDSLLHRVLFASRSRYSHKLRALQFTIATLAEEFYVSAEDLSSGMHTRPDESWLALDSLHYDLNTCLRETMVLLKSFLRVLPDATLETVAQELTVPVSHEGTPLPQRSSRATSR